MEICKINFQRNQNSWNYTNYVQH